MKCTVPNVLIHTTINTESSLSEHMYFGHNIVMKTSIWLYAFKYCELQVISGLCMLHHPLFWWGCVCALSSLFLKMWNLLGHSGSHLTQLQLLKRDFWRILLCHSRNPNTFKHCSLATTYSLLLTVIVTLLSELFWIKDICCWILHADI